MLKRYYVVCAGTEETAIQMVFNRSKGVYETIKEAFKAKNAGLPVWPEEDVYEVTVDFSAMKIDD